MSMKYEEWNALASDMAVETIVSEAREMMIAPEQSRPMALRWKEKGDQRWHREFRNMGNAIIALEKLGYRIEKVSRG